MTCMVWLIRLPRPLAFPWVRLVGSTNWPERGESMRLGYLLLCLLPCRVATDGLHLSDTMAPVMELSLSLSRDSLSTASLFKVRGGQRMWQLLTPGSVMPLIDSLHTGPTFLNNSFIKLSINYLIWVCHLLPAETLTDTGSFLVILLS